MIDWQNIKLTPEQIEVCKKKCPELDLDEHWTDYIYKQHSIRQILPGEFPFGE